MRTHTRARPRAGHVTVQGERYRSTDETLRALEELGRRAENTPEFGPKRKQLEQHREQIQAAHRELAQREAEAEQHAATTRARAQARERTAGERAARGRAAAGARPRTRRQAQRREFTSGARRQTRTFLRRTGADTYVGGAADLVWKAIGVVLGLVIVYQFVRHPGKTTGAIQFGGQALSRLIDPTDRLFFTGAKSAPASSPTLGGPTAATSGGTAPAGPSRPPDRGTAKVAKAATGPLAILGRLIGFPYQGSHTLFGNWQSDNAIDISVPVGTPVYAVTAGVIGDQIGPFQSADPHLAGQRLTLQGAGNSYYYAHLSKLLVRAGQQVQAGQLLGYSGSANGVAHLHFAAEYGNPIRILANWLKGRRNR